MMAEFDGLRFLRVLPPLASTPVGLHGWRPPAVRPSPPPIGWLTGFIEVPRLCGLRPMCRLRPALPRLMPMCSALPMAPIVARHSLDTRRTSPEGSVTCAHLPSRAVSVALVPALRQIWAPRPGCISRLWIVMPSGMFFIGMQWPTRGSDFCPLMTLSPTLSPSGAMMYAFSPSSYWTSAMRAERLGSYSIDCTVAQTSSFLRLKSMTRYIFLWPPPRKRVQTMPWLLRPPFFGLGRNRDFSGRFFLPRVRSEKSLTEPPRRPALVGLYLRMPMTNPHV